MFLSIFVATCRPDNVVKFLDNLAETAEDLTSFEVLLKVDDDDQKSIEVIKAYQQRAKFSVKCLGTEKLDGYYSLHVGYNELLKIADPNTYFCWLLTDEIRFESKGWDSVLKKYVGFYKDDIFRIKLSIFQLKNYYDLFECLPMPDNYAVTTRKWLEITGGWGDFWGPDSWHQCVDYFLGLNKNKFYPHGIWRSFPIYDIKIGGQEAGQGIPSEEALRKRARMIHKGWAYHSTYKAQENYSRLAARLNAHIYAMSSNLSRYHMIENVSQKTITLLNEDNVILQQLNYRIRKFNFVFQLGQTVWSFKNGYNLLRYYYYSSLNFFNNISIQAKEKSNEMISPFTLQLLKNKLNTKKHAQESASTYKLDSITTINDDPIPSSLKLLKRVFSEIEIAYVAMIRYFKKYEGINFFFKYPYKAIRWLVIFLISLLGTVLLLLTFIFSCVLYIIQKCSLSLIALLANMIIKVLKKLNYFRKIFIIPLKRIKSLIMKSLPTSKKRKSSNYITLFYNSKNLEKAHTQTADLD